MTPLTNTILRLHNEGLWDISAGDIAKAHGKLYMTSPDDVVLRMPTVINELHKSRHQEAYHLITPYHFENEYVFRVPYDLWWPSAQADSHSFQIAKLCLPIFTQNYGIRFIPFKKMDYLLFVWQYFVDSSVAGKAFWTTEFEKMAFLRGNLPAPVLTQLISGKGAAIPDAIDGTEKLPHPTVNIKEGFDRVLASCWENSFMEDKKKAKRRETKHDPNYKPGFKKGYGYQK